MSDLVNNRVYLARFIGYKNNKPLFRAAQPCDFNSSTIHMMRRAGYKDVKPFGRFMTAACGSDGSPIVGNIYPARLIGFRNGKPLFKFSCVICGGSGSGSGGGTCLHPTCCNWCCQHAAHEPATTAPSTLTGSVTSLCGSYTQVMDLTECMTSEGFDNLCGAGVALQTASIVYGGETIGSAVAGQCASVCGFTISGWADERYSLGLVGYPPQSTFCEFSGVSDATCIWKVFGSWRDATKMFSFCALPTVVSCNPFYAYARATIVCDEFGTYTSQGYASGCHSAWSECSACVGNEVLIEITE